MKPTYSADGRRFQGYAATFVNATVLYRLWSEMGDIDSVPSEEEAKALHRAYVRAGRPPLNSQKPRVETVISMLRDRYYYSPVVDDTAIRRALVSLSQEDLSRLTYLETRVLGELLTDPANPYRLPWGYKVAGTHDRSPRGQLVEALPREYQIRLETATKVATRRRRHGTPPILDEIESLL